jgi:hypothetical protein
MDISDSLRQAPSADLYRLFIAIGQMLGDPRRSVHTRPLSLTLRVVQLTRLRQRHREHNGRNSPLAIPLVSPTSI